MNLDRALLVAPPEVASEVVCGPRFVHSDIPPETGPVWRLVTGADSHNFDYWPPEADDPLPAILTG